MIIRSVDTHFILRKKQKKVKNTSYCIVYLNTPLSLSSDYHHISDRPQPSVHRTQDTGDSDSSRLEKFINM